jgi:hypothetical protein
MNNHHSSGEEPKKGMTNLIYKIITKNSIKNVLKVPLACLLIGRGDSGVNLKENEI